MTGVLFVLGFVAPGVSKNHMRNRLNNIQDDEEVISSTCGAAGTKLSYKELQFTTSTFLTRLVIHNNE